MGKALEFFIPVAVKPKQSFRWGKHGGHPAPKTHANAVELGTYASVHAPPEPWDVAILARLVFQFAWPKATPKKRRHTSRYKTTRPDLDNLTKQVLDVLQACGFFTDDARIVELSVTKLHTDEDGVQICLWQLEEDDA